MEAENIEYIDDHEYNELRQLANKIESRIGDMPVARTLTIHGNKDSNHSVHLGVTGEQATANVAQRLNDLSCSVTGHAITESGKTHFTFSIWLER